MPKPTNPTATYIGATIKAKREQLQLTQRALCAKANITQNTLRKIENGHVLTSFASLLPVLEMLGLVLVVKEKEKK